MLPTPTPPSVFVAQGRTSNSIIWFVLGEEVAAGEDLGGLLVVVPEELAAHGDDVGGQGLQAQAPEAHVGLVDALVADVAVAVGPVPVPVVVDVALRERPLLGRALPDVPVEGLAAGCRGPWRGRSRAASGRPGRGPCRPCRWCRCGGGRRPRGPPRSCGAGRRAGRSGCTCGPPRPSCGLRRCCGCRASRRRRPCRPGRPRSSPGECQWFGVATLTTSTSLRS